MVVCGAGFDVKMVGMVCGGAAVLLVSVVGSCLTIYIIREAKRRREKRRLGEHLYYWDCVCVKCACIHTYPELL